MNISLIKALFFLLLTWVISTSVHAEGPPFATQKQTKEFLEAINKNGNEIKTTAGFYQAGLDCHTRQLNGLSYYPQPHALLFLTNDSLGNCQLSQIFINPTRDQLITGFTCTISDSEFKKIFAPWFLDALKNYDETKKINPMMEKFIFTVNECMKSTSFAVLYSIVLSSTPKQPTKSKTNVIH